MAGLNIRFEKLRTGVHFIVDDGCEIDLEEDEDGNWTKTLDNAQRNFVNSGLRSRRERHLYYFNMGISDMHMEDDPIKLSCPTCKKNYEVTREDYDDALIKFRGEA